MKKEAETAMEKRIEELRMAQRILDEQLRSKQVAVQQVLTERKPCNVENVSNWWIKLLFNYDITPESKS